MGTPPAGSYKQIRGPQTPDESGFREATKEHIARRTSSRMAAASLPVDGMAVIPFVMEAGRTPFTPALAGSMNAVHGTGKSPALGQRCRESPSQDFRAPKAQRINHLCHPAGNVRGGGVIAGSWRRTLMLADHGGNGFGWFGL
jgi:hypothetical protein